MTWTDCDVHGSGHLGIDCPDLYASSAPAPMPWPPLLFTCTRCTRCFPFMHDLIAHYREAHLKEY